MISNPKKYCLIQERRDYLILMRDLADIYDHLPTEELMECIKELGVTCAGLMQEIQKCPQIVDEELPETQKWLLRAQILKLIEEKA